MNIKRLSDGILFQFLMVGSLSFSHIHDVVAAHGQAGWKAWMYPPSVDLLTVAAYRKILAARRDPNEHGGMAWCAFLLGMAASLAANIVDAWAAGASGLAIAVAIGVWPPVALLVCTMLGHDQPTPAPTVQQAPPQPVPAPAVVPEVSAPAPASARPVAAVQVAAPPALVSPPATEPAPPAAVASALPPIAPPLLNWARGIADQHRQTTGNPITPDMLATRLRIAPALAETVRDHLIAETAGA